METLLQIRNEPIGSLVSILRRLFNKFHHDRRQRRRDIRIQFVGHRDRPCEMLVHQFEGIIRLERTPADEQFIQGDAQKK